MAAAEGALVEVNDSGDEVVAVGLKVNPPNDDPPVVKLGELLTASEEEDAGDAENLNAGKLLVDAGARVVDEEAGIAVDELSAAAKIEADAENAAFELLSPKPTFGDVAFKPLTVLLLVDVAIGLPKILDRLVPLADPKLSVDDDTGLFVADTLPLSIKRSSMLAKYFS